jgi:hypothetical protein
VSSNLVVGYSEPTSLDLYQNLYNLNCDGQAGCEALEVGRKLAERSEGIPEGGAKGDGYGPLPGAGGREGAGRQAVDRDREGSRRAGNRGGPRRRHVPGCLHGEAGRAVYVLHAFQKKSKHGIATPKHEIDLIEARYDEAKRIHAELEREQ